MTPIQSRRRRRHASARSYDATMRRAHPSRCHARHTSSGTTPPWGTLSMLPLRVTGTRPRAEQRTRPRTSAALQEAGRAWKGAPTPLASLRAHHRGPLRPGDGGIWTTHAWQATPAAPVTTQNRRRPKTWASGSTGSPQRSSSPWQSASDGFLLRGPATSRREPAPWRTSPSAIGRGTRPPATMSHPGQWHYVATRLMAHMGAYSSDEMNRLHWQWHQRAALRIRAAMQQHNIWDIPGSRGYRGHASGHRRPRSQDIPEPPRMAARCNSPKRQRGPPPRMGSPSGTYKSPLQPFAPRRGPGSPHTSGMQGGTPEQRQETRTPSRSHASAARRLPRNTESSFMRIQTETMEVGTTPTPSGHHLPPIPDADPRGPAPNGHTSPPFPRQLSASERQRFTRAPAGQQTERPAHPPPPSQGRRPTRCRGEKTPWTRGQGSPRRTKGLRKGWGDSPP